MRLALMPIIYLQAYPWVLDLVRSTAAYGDGTEYPVKTGLGFTHDIYWNTRRLRIAGSCGVSNPNGSLGVQLGATGDDRADDAANLFNLTEGHVRAEAHDSGGLQIALGSVNYTFFAEAQARVHDFREQHLRQLLTGSISSTGTPDPNFDVNVSFSSTGGTGKVIVGFCTCIFARTYNFPLYASVAPGYSVEANFTVTRDKWRP